MQVFKGSVGTGSTGRAALGSGLAGWWLAAVLVLAGPQAAQALKLAVAGPEELVAAAETMTCKGRNPRGFDVTDMPPSAFRRDDGTVILLAGNRANWFFEGPSLDAVRRTGCQSLLAPVNSPDPAQHRSHEWIFGLHSRDGRTVLGFVHNEYHGHEHGHQPCTVTNRSDYPCWYGSTTLIKSEDGGRTFARPPAPANVLLSMPWRFTPGRLRAGATGPKVVGNPDDGRAYVLATFFDRTAGVQGGQCLLRGSGASLDDWELWDGQRFAPYDASPYGCTGTCAGRLADSCAPVLRGNVSSVRYVPSAKAFVAIFLARGGVMYRTSPNLIEWSAPQMLWDTTLTIEHQPGGPRPAWYFSLLDPTSTSRNFDTLEGRPYLYFARFRLDGDRINNGRRDVMRVPLRIE